MATNTAPAAPPVPSPTPSIESAPVPVDVSRIIRLVQVLIAAHDARQISTWHLTFAELIREVRALPAGAVPALQIAPVEKVRREVNRDGLAYELEAKTITGRPHMMLKLLDVTGDDALAYCEPADVRTLIADLSSVLAWMEGGRG